MNNNTRVNEYLGAKWFRKCALKLEELKYKIIDRLFPNYEELYEARLTKKYDKELEKPHTDEEKEKIKFTYHKKILEARKEKNSKRNRNYHLNRDNPMEMVKHLENNKRIHVKGLIKNGVIYGTLIILFILKVPLYVTIPLTVLNTISSAINFECINLQNYNIKRFEANKDKFEELRKRKEERDLEKYKDISHVVSTTINNSREIPKKEDIVGALTTREQILQMRNLILSYSDNNGNREREKEKAKCQH